MRRANVSVTGTTAFFLLMLLLVALQLPSTVHAVDIPEQEFTDLRVKWRAWLVGTSDYDHNDPDIRAAIRALDASLVKDNKKGFWDTMNKDASRTTLWPDTADKAKSALITTSYRRLRAMALAYSTEASSLYLNTQLKQDVVSALDWMYSNRYNEREKEVDNWWDWEIGTPQLLNDITAMLHDELSAPQRKNYMNAVNHFVPDPTVRTLNGAKEFGANRADKALVCMIAGIIDKSSETIFKGQAAVSQVFEYVRSGDGFYEDGSFIQHNHVAYTGGYGAVLIAGISNIMAALGDSRWRITDPNQQNVYRWVRESIVPFIYRGAMMDNVRGRSISRFSSQDHIVGREMITSIMRMSAVAEPHEAEFMKRAVKRWVTEDTTFASYYAGMDIVDAIRLKAVMSNPSIPLQDELTISSVYTSMARAVHRQPGYGFAVSMFSPRVTAFEAGNGENRKGWYTGMGMTTLYDNDLLQFSEDYWATVDMYRLPGTTTDGAPIAPLKEWYLFPNPKTWVGGASLDDEFSAVGMDFSLDKSTGSSLQGKKSWFMFPDAIYCMGTGIRGTGGRNVETIVENRRLRGGGAERVLSVNGEQVPSPSMGRSESQWAWSAHISGVDGAAGTGYYFPQGVIIETLRDVRTGSWNDVNQGGSTAALTNTFLSVSIPHGSNPAGERYHYIVLPGKTAAETEDYVPNPVQIQVVSDSETIHAVSQMKADEYIINAANFWSADSVYYFEAESPLSVFMKEDLLSGKLHVAISDPTQAQNSVVLGLLLMKGYVLDSKDEEVTVSMTESKINIQVRTAGAQGATFHAVFRKA